MNEIESKSTQCMDYGVYFLSNNSTYDLTIAFLNSFRRYNPTLPLCFIPFDNDVKKIESLKHMYHFDVFEDIELLKRCDSISLKFHDKILGAYRKLVMWEGQFNNFIYIDVDTVVLENLDFSFQFLDAFQCLTSHSNMANIKKFVWKDNIFESGHLSHEQINFSANTGFIVSTKRFMTMDWISSRVEHALEIKNCMALDCQEQSFLNYLMVTNGAPYSSLSSLYNQYNDVLLECWGGVTDGEIKDGKIYFDDRIVFLVHWAGLWKPNGNDVLYNKILKFLGLSRFERKVNSRLPNKKLWTYYRNLEIDSKNKKRKNIVRIF